jgi:hypothetical protein
VADKSVTHQALIGVAPEIGPTTRSDEAAYAIECTRHPSVTTLQAGLQTRRVSPASPG